MKMATTGKYTALKNLSIDGKMYPIGADVSWWDRAPEFVGKSVHLEKIDKRADKPIKNLNGEPYYTGLGDDELRVYAKAQGVNVTWNMKRETILERLAEVD